MMSLLMAGTKTYLQPLFLTGTTVPIHCRQVPSIAFAQGVNEGLRVLELRTEDFWDLIVNKASSFRHRSRACCVLGIGLRQWAGQGYLVCHSWIWVRALHRRIRLFLSVLHILMHLEVQ